MLAKRTHKKYSLFRDKEQAVSYWSGQEARISVALGMLARCCSIQLNDRENVCTHPHKHARTHINWTPAVDFI